jgi:glutamine synthetase
MAASNKVTGSRLKEIAENNGLRYVMPLCTSFYSDSRGCLVPISALDNLQKNGFGYYTIDHFKLEPNDAEMFGVPDPETLVKLPWKPELGVVLW